LKETKLDSEYLKKSVNNLCIDLISMCDDFMIEVQEKQESKMMSSDMSNTLIINILLNFNVNLIILWKKNCPKINVIENLIKLNELMLDALVI
jgi:hypothetical protein